MNWSFSLVIPVWNGEKLLEKNLPLILKTLPREVEIILADDSSTDNSVKLLNSFKKRYEKRDINIIARKHNLGFVKNVNQAIGKAKGELIILLNSDVVPEKGFLAVASKHFAKKDVFAVSFNEKNQPYGWSKIWWRGGFIHLGNGGKAKRAHVSAWASGGSAVFRKSMWQQLGGFDEIYSPFYWEDFDLGFRAWARGWKIIWEPRAMVDHKHEASTSKIDSDYVNLIKERNQLLFIWKNISYPWWRISNFFGMILRVLLGPNYLKVIGAAIKQYWKFDKPKLKERIFNDKEIIARFK